VNGADEIGSDEMVEPAGIGSAASKATDQVGPLLQRALGPSADVIGEHWAAKLRDRFAKTRRVVDVANRRIRDSDHQGRVPPRVANRVFEESEYCDDELVTEYLGGVLASSKTSLDMADLGNTYASYVAHLAVDHLRAHYYIYAELQRVAHGKTVRWPFRSEVAEAASLLIPFGVAFRDFCPSSDYEDLLSILWWLQREQLLLLRELGVSSTLARAFDGVQADGVVVQPTALGVELFMWGLGRGARKISRYLSDDPSDYVVDELQLRSGYQIVKPRSQADRTQDVIDALSGGTGNALDVIRNADIGKMRVRNDDDME
jgi:hypothetical protein